MILTAAIRSGLSVARGAARLASGATSHLIWWLDHHVGGDPRKAPDDPRRHSSDSR